MANTDPMAVMKAMMQAVQAAPPPQSYSVSSTCVPVSGSLNWTSIQHPQPWSEESLVAKDKEIQEEVWNKMGNYVLSNVEAHTTARIGELADIIHTKLQILKGSVSLTNAQWIVFAELMSSITDLIGDPHNAKLTESHDASS